jgi:hypothetical protein
MSILIEDLIEQSKGVKTYSKDCNKWYIAKYLPLYGFFGFVSRLRDAYRVLIDKSRAYHYKEDEE